MEEGVIVYAIFVPAWKIGAALLPALSCLLGWFCFVNYTTTNIQIERTICLSKGILFCFRRNQIKIRTKCAPLNGPITKGLFLWSLWICLVGLSVARADTTLLRTVVCEVCNSVTTRWASLLRQVWFSGMKMVIQGSQQMCAWGENLPSKRQQRNLNGNYYEEAIETKEANENEWHLQSHHSQKDRRNFLPLLHLHNYHDGYNHCTSQSVTALKSCKANVIWKILSLSCPFPFTCASTPLRCETMPKLGWILQEDPNVMTTPNAQGLHFLLLPLDDTSGPYRHFPASIFCEYG